MTEDSATAYAQMRSNMVNSQVRPNQVNDRRVIAAMRTLPREKFVPAGQLAYADTDIPLGHGRFMLAPLLIARLTQLVMVRNPVHVLVVGAGSGYGAAVLADAGAQVVALEQNGPPPVPMQNVKFVEAKLTSGWPADGPYDAILIEGAVAAIPEIFAQQLAPGGRVVTILAEAGPAGSPGIGRAVVAEPASAGFAVLRVFDCSARLLPQFQPAAAFVF